MCTRQFPTTTQSNPIIVCLSVGFCILATLKEYQKGYQPVTVGTRSCFIVRAVSLDDWAAGTMTQYLTQSHYPDIEQTSHCPNQLNQVLG